MEAIIPIITQALGIVASLAVETPSIVSIVQAVEKALSSGSADPTSDEWQAVDALIAANTVTLNTDPA